MMVVPKPCIRGGHAAGYHLTGYFLAPAHGLPPLLWRPKLSQFSQHRRRLGPLSGPADGDRGCFGLGGAGPASYFRLSSLLHAGPVGPGWTRAGPVSACRHVAGGGRAAAARARRHPGPQRRQVHQPGIDAPRPPALDGAEAILQLWPRLGGARHLAAVADEPAAWLRPADPLPPLRRQQARR